MKKIISLLLTFVFAVCMITNVSATTNGSIVINGTTSGKTYEIYKIFDLTYSGSNVSYTIASDWEAFFSGAGSTYIVDNDTDPSSLNPITVGNSTKYINITNDNIEAFTQAALAYAATLKDSNGENKNDGSAVAQGDSLTFSGLALGYYLIYPQGATDKTNGTICSVGSTLPNDNHLDPVAVVNIKATYPTIEKTVNDQNTEVGQTVTFTVKGQVPDTTGYTSYTYKLEDTMTAGLLFNDEIANLQVMFGDNEIAVTPVYANNGFTLEFNMVNYQDYVGEVITITYNALVTEDAVNSDETNNSVTLTYSNNPKDSTSFGNQTIEVPVYSSEINVEKVDASDNETKLAGAKFVVKNSEGKYYQAALDKDGNNFITNTTSTSDVQYVRWVDDIDDATVLVTDSTGIITFEGVENGTYYLEEIEAPAGYNKLPEDIEIKVGYIEVEENNKTVLKLGSVGVSYTEQVENNSGTELPHTGGVGTKLFIIIGSLLMIASAIILITNKRMAKEY